jgi:hypothetical protein
MANPNFDDDDKPLDPSVKRVETRVRRLILIAGLTLGLGIFAVFAAILYRIGNLDTTAKPISPDAAIPSLSLTQMGLPADARLVSTALDGSRLALTYETGEGTVTVVVDVKSGAVIGRLRIGGVSPPTGP